MFDHARIRRRMENMRSNNTSSSINTTHRNVIPSRWSPTGWKYVPDGHQDKALNHANKRNIIAKRSKS